MSKTALKRPLGLTVIAVIWFFAGLYNAYVSYQTVTTDVGVLPLLSDPGISPWASFGVPAELVLYAILLVVALMQILVVPGLLIGKRYSYKLALAVPVLLVVFNLSLAALYLSAPAELNLGNYVTSVIVAGFVGIFWVAIYWGYLRKTHVKTFLGIEVPAPTESSITIPPPPNDYVAHTVNMESNPNTFYCRYCGTSNKADAVFCEKCGKQMR